MTQQVITKIMDYKEAMRIKAKAFICGIVA